MMDRYKTELDKAVDYAMIGDFGQALVCTFRVYAEASLVSPDQDAKRVSVQLISKLNKIVEIEFNEYAKRKGIKVSPHNRNSLMNEHSRHYVRAHALIGD